MACVELARKQIKMATTNNVAAIIVEPMQGTAGNIVPPKEFLPAIKQLCEEIGALLIADEMITGFGRSGRYWGVEHSGVVPDIITLGKQFGGGFPISAVLSREEIVSSKPWGNPSGSSSSYGGNPLAAAAAAASLRIIDEEKLVENSKKVGAHFLKKLQPLAEKYPFVGFVGGEGLFLRVELVRDKKTKEPLAKSVTHRIFNECVKRGLLTMAYDAHFRIQPSMSIDEATVDEAVGILDEVFTQAEKSGYWKQD
jgi:4-aminobutyrate aminotransferase-like enzyme